MKAYFVTGTDTAAGKTTVAAALLAAAVRRGLRVAARKPVESGCERGPDGALRPRDAERLRQAAGGWQTLDAVCPWRFEAALAPAFAAARVGVTLDLAAIATAARRPEEDVDLLLVEGAGGLLVPLAGAHCVVDLVARLGHPLLVVGRAGLGTINHTSMTVEVARRRGLVVAAVVLSDGACGPTDRAAIAENAEAIARATGVAVLGCLPHLPEPTLGALAAAAERHLDLGRLLGPGEASRAGSRR